MKRYIEKDGVLKIDWDAVEMRAENLEAAKSFKDYLTLYCDAYLNQHPELLKKMGDYCIRIIVSSKI